ncbi:threonine/serine exporter family protein [Bifidobacterium choloepi]|uniref:Threonine/serine exporter family protein n=1 Tax=Bifidobacterium choloepi TaxID=2614131 RepID=A0A6I5N312_9BIFI|nr:threonine/serine exporter family protein [Bifidobacterium choloepi]
MEDIEQDWDKPITEAGIAAKASVIVRVGMLDLGAGTGSFRVREMMHRIAYPLGVHVRADVNLTDIQATCTDGKNRITEVVNLPTTGVNTERIWLLEHFADWFSVNLGTGATYHSRSEVSTELMNNLDVRDASQVSADISSQLREEDKKDEEAKAKLGTAVWLDAASTAQKNAEAELAEAAAAGDEDAADAIGVEAGSVDARVASMQAKMKLASDESAQAAAQVGKTANDSSATAASETASGPAAASASADRSVAGSAAAAREAPKRRLKRRADRRERMLRKIRAEMDDSMAVDRERGVTVRQAHRRLDLIEHRAPLYSPAFSGFAAACACAAFVFLLGGGPIDMVGAFVGAGIGQWLRRIMLGKRINQFFVTFVAVAVAALCCVGTLRLIGLFNPIALQHDTAYIGAILFVIPGFPLITGGMDMAKVDFPSGIQRVAYVLTVIIMATLAGWMVAAVVRLNPQGFEPLGLNPWVNCGLRALFAFIGVWGFSVLFNSPQRMCLVAAVIGLITDTLRLEMIDWGLAPEAGAFIGALLAGLLASAWRSAVRRGMLPPHLGYPRICLTVPSIVIMVPGLYMYQAMFNLGQLNTNASMDWAFRAFMIIICLPIGLVMARVLTDRSWRYDI